MVKTILIIDDEESFAEIVKLDLEKTGKYKVETENKGACGLAAAKRLKPDLILLDVMMPDMSGGEVAYQIKEDENIKNIPIVFLTALATTEETSWDGTIDGYPFIAKPVGMKELVDCIEENIHK